MADKRVCGKCGAQLSDVGAEQLCPGCLLEAGLEASHDGFETLSNHCGGQPEPSYPRAFGDYELLEEIARGGMGIVYKARQASLDRIVALKMLLFGPLASPEFVQRFRTEAAAAASLQHPNIVAIHEVGFREGQHFFAMDYVAGQSLAEVVRAGPLPTQRAAGYVKTIAEAIQYAHERGILHRDLKPSNVLIDEFDQPRVTDFGLAKRLEKETDLTLSGQVLGSPNYMAPEQAAARRGQVGKRSDVYSLGAILYHLLTGQPPFVALTVAETLEQVRNVEPTSPRLSNPHLARDLETICLKCLEKEPARRYATAQELADELGRFLNKEPILARPVSRLEKVWRWCRRNPVPAALIALVTLVFLVGFAGVAWEGDRARKAAADAQRQGDIAKGRLYAAQMKLAHAAFKDGKIGGALTLLRAQHLGPDQPDFRGFDWRYLYGLCLGSPGEVITTNASSFQSVGYSPDGRMVAFGTSDGMIELFDGQTHQCTKRWQAHEGTIDYLAFYPQNNNWLATVSGDDGILKLWDVTREGILLSTKVGRGMFADFAFSPGGRFLTTRATDAQSIDLWEVHRSAPDATPTLTQRMNLGFIGPVAFSPDERTVALCNQVESAGGWNVALYDLVDGDLTDLPIAHADIIISAAFSPDGSMLATGGADERVILWDIKEQKAICTNRSDFILVTSVAFTPDGQSLFASSWDQNIRSWNIQDMAQTNVLRGHSDAVNRLAIAPDGLSLTSASSDGTARLWPLHREDFASILSRHEEVTTLFSPKDVPPTRREQVVIFAVAVSPTQDRAVAGENYMLISCDLGSGTIVASVDVTKVFEGEEPGFGFARLTFSPDGRELAVGSSDGRVAFLDANSLQPLRTPIKLHEAQITHIAYALNGAVLATGGAFGTGIKLTDVASGQIIMAFSAVEGSFPIQPLAVSHDGKRLATGSPQGQVRVWDIAKCRVVASSPQKVRFLHDVAFSPNGKLLAFANERGAIFLWDLSGHRPLRKLLGHAGPVNMLAFSPDGRTLASGGMDHTIRLWHPEIDQEVAILTGHGEWVWCVAFAEHGNALLSGSRDGTLRLWRAISFEEIEAGEKVSQARP